MASAETPIRAIASRRRAFLFTGRLHLQPVASHPSAATLQDRVCLFVVAGLAVGLAIFSFVRFLDSSRFLWGSLVHDRNAHYLLGLSLAQDVQHADLRQLLIDLDGARTWPPLHGILVALVLLVGGVHYQLAVLPSLACWVGTVVFGFLTARRMAPCYGNLAGLAAGVFILASPAHHAYATDIMLESTGACLSLMALYFYMLPVGGQRRWPTRALAVALTALFFLKYNYWSLVIVALVATELISHWTTYRTQLQALITAADWRQWLRSQLRNPWNWILTLLLCGICLVLLGGGQTIWLFNTRVSIQSPHNLLHLAYIIVFVRAVFWLRHRWRWLALEIGSAWSTMLLWHGVPITLWFLWPKRLGYFLWYLFANGGETPQRDLPSSFHFYASSLVADYHLGFWSAAGAGLLFIIVIASYRRLRPGSVAVLLFVLLAALATLPHPNRKSRFLHSWIAAGWVGAGVGLVSLIPTRASSRVRRFGQATVAGAVTIIAVAHAPGFVSAGDSTERGHDDYLPASTRDLTDFYLPGIANSGRVVIFSTMEIKHLLRWSYMERGGRRQNLELEYKDIGPSPDENRRTFDDWLRRTDCDTIVFIDVPRGTYLHEMTSQPDAVGDELRELLTSQSVFHVTSSRSFSLYGCAVFIFQRT